jgi:hypothetical protein
VALPPSVLLFPVGLVVLVGLVAAAAFLMSRPGARPADMVAAGFGLSASFAALAVSNAGRPACPPSGLRRIGPDEFRSCFDSVVFSVELWAGASVAAFVVSACAAGAVRTSRRQRSR